MNRISPVVKQLIIINVIIFIGVNMSPPAIEQYFVLYPLGSSDFKPVQFFTHMFMHGDLWHIVFNMASLYFIGPTVEAHLGEKKFLFFYFFCGLGAVVAHIVFGTNARVVGASGAIYGVFAAFAYLFPNVRLMLLFPPIPVKAKFLVMGLVAYDLFSGMSGAQTGIAHFAHIGGAVFGFLLLLFWQKTGR